jgi:hypothetical protein
MVALSVYRSGHVCSNVWTVAALCSSLLKSTEPLRKVTSSVRIKLYDHTLDVCIICKCVLPAQILVLFRKVRPPSIQGTTSMIRSLPVLDRIHHHISYRDQVEFLELNCYWESILYKWLFRVFESADPFADFDMLFILKACPPSRK